MIYTGALDGAAYDPETQNVSVAGWAAEFYNDYHAATDRRLTVYIRAWRNGDSTNNVNLGETVAYIYREDLEAASIGDGSHGFDVQFSVSSLDVARWEITAWVVDPNTGVPTYRLNSVTGAPMYIYNGAPTQRDKIIKGDINNDGRLSIEDYHILRKAVLREDGFVLQSDDLKSGDIVSAVGNYPIAADVNALDEILNAFDCH